MMLVLVVQKETSGHRLRAVCRVVDGAGADRLRALGYPAETYVITSHTEAERDAAIAAITQTLGAQAAAAGHTLEATC